MITQEDLELKNLWWQKPDFQIPESKWPKRDIFKVIKNNLKHSLTLNIVGLRRVGKSTILKQIIALLLFRGVDAENIFYFLFDYSSQIHSAAFLDEVLSVYFNTVLKKPAHTLNKKIYVFLDEIQYIEDWQVVVKKFYDLSGKRIKFIVTGSQSLLLKRKDHESLAGRIFDFYLPPLSFPEFLDINHEKIEQPEKFNLFDLPEDYSRLVRYNTYNKEKISRLSREYVTTGQFPEIRQFKSLENRHEYIVESVLGKVMEDCVRVFKIEKPDEFKLITYQLLNNVSSIFELSNIGREISIARPTLDKYLGYLKEGYIIEILWKYHKSVIKRGKIAKKLYTPCANFVCALNHYREDQIDEVPEAFGKIMENLIFNVLTKKLKDGKLAHSLSFYRQRDKEIDFLLLRGKEILPIEVKFSNKINSRDLKTITEYAKKRKLDYGLVVTKNELAMRIVNGQKLFFIPYYLILFASF